MSADATAASAAEPTAPPPATRSVAERALAGWRGPLIVFLVFAATYLAVAGGRLREHSPYNQYVYLAEGWLHGRLTLAGQPPNENDWAKIDVLKLRDGRELRGIYGSRTGGPVDRFYPLRGKSESVPESEIASRSTIRLVSFPPFPAVLMLPFVAVSGLRFNDVLFTALWAALNPALLFLLLRELRRRGYSRRTETDDLWLTVMLGAGSVHFFCSVLGQVWFTGLVVAVTVSIAYVWASLDARYPALAGLFVGLGFATRPPWFVVPFFFFEAVRHVGGAAALRTPEGRRAFWRLTVAFAGPIAVIGLVLAWYNAARFGSPFEFGHRYLPVQWQERIFRFGLFNYHFLSRNLAAALILLPRIMDHYPFVRVSQHGMSVLVTSPNLVYTVMPPNAGPRSPLTRGLWITVLTTALPSLLYQGSGYVQFGYRYSLDVMVYLMVLLAVGNRRFTRLFKGLVVVSIAINLFLAITFNRYMQFSYDDSFFPHGNN